MTFASARQEKISTALSRTQKHRSVHRDDAIRLTNDRSDLCGAFGHSLDPHAHQPLSIIVAVEKLRAPYRDR
jgi:hypothetical protein